MMQLHNHNWEEYSTAEKYSVKIKYDKIFIFFLEPEWYHCPAQQHFKQVGELTGDAYQLEPFPFYEAEPQVCKNILLHLYRPTSTFVMIRTFTSLIFSGQNC